MKMFVEICHINATQVVVGVRIADSELNKEIYVLGFSTRSDSDRFVELAQARAIALARRILSEGLDAVDPAEYATVASPPTSTTQPTAFTPTVISDTAPVSMPVIYTPSTSEPEPTDPQSDQPESPEVPW